MSVLTLNVDEVMRTLSAESSNPFVVHDKEVDIVRFAINSGFADIILDGQVALRVMYQRPGESEVRAQTLTYYDTDGLHNYYDWQLSQSDLAKNGSLMVALCILDISGGEVSEWHTTPCEVRVLSTIHTDDSDEGDDTITPTVKERVAVLESMIQRVASGAPIVVASMSAMTDTNQIYVLSTNGRWYYHNGSAWVAGGEYGGVADGSVTTDKLANKAVTRAKVSDDFDSALTNFTALSSIVYSASSVPVEVKTDENDNIIVTIPNRIYVCHITKLGVFAYDTIDQPGDYTIPDGSYLIAESETKTLSIKTFSEIRALDKTKKYTILCENNKGMPFGTLSQYLLMEEIPYYTSYVTQVANKINTNKGAFGLNGLSFIFITDEHWKQNAKKSVYLIKELRKKTGIDMLINCGDILTKEKTKELAYSKISEHITELEDTNCKVYSCIGNHEYNNPNMSQAAADLAITLTLAEVCSVMYNRSNYSNAVFDLVSGCYYYDIDKTRIFVLQCNYGSNVYLTATRWILERMMELPEGYKIILFSHVIVEWSQSIETSVPKDRVNAVLNAMDAIKAGTSITYENRTYDYSNLSNVTPIAAFGGHAHIDYSFNTPGGIPVILTTCDSDIQESGGLTRTRGTTTEQAFDVVLINYDTRTIKLVRVGAGSDRTFTY